MGTAARVPLVPSASLSEFGDLHDHAEFYDANGRGGDQSYVPGFSDLRRQAAIELAEYQRGQRNADEVTKLPVNCRWARSQNRAGQPDTVKPFGHGRKGYRMVTQKDVGTPWLKEMPPGSQVAADGTIRNGDCVLMVADAKDAAKNEIARRITTEQRVSGYKDSFANAVAEAKRKNPALNTAGLVPTVTKT